MTLYMVELPVVSLAESVAWYRDVLGLGVALTDETNGFAMLDVPGGGRVALKLRAAVEAGGVALHFHVPDLDAELARLAVRRVVPEAEVATSAEGYRSAQVRDPDGHALGLFEWA